ncbi:hypothetical protein [Ruminococcus sp.]|uniref:hypothetical protein n=1 Tax=Ruminococcus sp. TaxID=41978 RepID=UPI002E776FA6|nr:hypothetical protein [Ruminococcus sp.]MEE1397732.1 hypothetical protein [Ruminococcus sp.]
MNCIEEIDWSDLITIIGSFVSAIITIIVVFISAYLSYKNMRKDSISQAREEVYLETLDMFYELKSERSIFLYDDSYLEKLKKNRAKILLFSSKNIFEEVNNIYTELSKLKEAYVLAGEPRDENECERLTNKYSVSEEFISNSIRKVVESMRRDLEIR